MFVAHGWLVIRSSRSGYAEPLTPEDEIDLDGMVDSLDEKLWRDFREYLGLRFVSNSFFQFQFREHLNNDSGMFSFMYSRNHRGHDMFELLEWISRNGPGSYGIIYVHDSEDVPGGIRDRGQCRDMSNEFRVWRMAKGILTEHDDLLLSPVYPTIDDEGECSAEDGRNE